MAELRWNPLLEDWVMVASHRQARPTMPKDWCPFCPGSGRVPVDYQLYRYPNDFPALRVDPPPPDPVDTHPLLRTAPAYGRCEVLLYAPEHRGTLAQLTDDHVHRLAALWREVFEEMAADPAIRYCYIFENRGAQVGVTMPHPHGQCYGYPFLPKTLERELAAARKHLEREGSCLFCGLLEAERQDGRRILFENQHFTVYIPFFSNTTYGVHVTARRHLPHLGAMSREELDSLGETIRDVSALYDHLFDSPFPYMMCMHNAPTQAQYPGGEECYHFHVEFVPPLRSATVQQFFAASETGAGAWCNPNSPEDKARELRAAYERAQAKLKPIEEECV